MTADPDLIKRSVTRDDYETEPRAGGPYGPTTLFLMPSLQPTPGLPAWWGPRRDVVLAATLDMESLWAGAIYKTVTKLASRGWVVEDADDSTRRTSRAQELLLNAGGAGGWIQFLGMHLQDYLAQDNGAFVEIIRASSAAGSRILGLQHLDAQRCWRTGDPDIPVLYTDLKGRQHEMKEHQALLFADLPSPRAEMRGVGRCAASRAWRKIHLMTSLEVYMDEKVSGARPQSIYIVNGAASHQIENAVKAAETKQLAAGYTIYRGAVVISAIKPDATLGVVEIPLASIPDKTDVGREREEARLIYAHCIGIDLQELQPQPAGLNSGMTAVVLAEKAKGQGLASWAKQWEHQTSHRVLPASTTFAWSERDLGEQRQQADIESVRAATRAARIETGEITVEQARQLAADVGDYPKEWLPQDTTPAGVLEDDEKPAEVAPQQEPQAANPLTTPVVVPVGVRRKATGDPAQLDRLIAQLEREIESLPGPDEAGLDAWEAAMTRALERAHIRALQTGLGQVPSDAALKVARAYLEPQLELLGAFATELKGRGWEGRDAARARLYANSIGASYWAGATGLLPLPAMPKDGTTQCRQGCKCVWDVRQLEGDGNYDATWQMGPAEHCQTCKERAQQWAPLRIRNGELL